MERVRYQFTDLGQLPDQLFACLSQWAEAASGNGEADEEAVLEPLLQAQVALYEWMANLVQHASFGDRRPFVQLDLEMARTGVGCVVEDNSDGFDIASALARRRDELNPMPERGMGLLLLYSTARNVRYDCLGPHRYRLSFWIPTHNDSSGLDLTGAPSHG